LDQHISADYRSDQRDGIPVSFPQFFAFTRVGIVSILVLALTIPAAYTSFILRVRGGAFMLSGRSSRFI